MFRRISDPGIDLILPGWRRIYEPQLINNQPVGLELPHRAGRYRPGKPSLSSPACWSCRGTEIFLIHRGMGPYLSRVALAPRTPGSQQSVCGVGTSTPCGAVSTGGTTVFPPVCWSCRCMEAFLIRRGPYPSRVTLAPRTPANQQSASVVRASTPCGAISNQGTAVFVQGLLEL